jgi:outer membrane lipoprotein-sorting protein
MKIITALILVISVAIALPAYAAEPKALALSAAQAADVARVETYLNSITTLKARFLQRSDSGEATGIFYMSRPGKMRLDYDEPLKNYIVADGNFVYFWDDELKQQTNAPIGSTLADLFLRDHIALAGDITLSALSETGNTLQLTVQETKDPGQGQMMMLFESHPLILRKWRVIDAQGKITDVALQDIETGVPLDEHLFVFIDPNFGQKHRR